MRLIAVALAIGAGLIVLVGYFVPDLAPVQVVLLNWAILLAGVATLVGVFNLISVHADKIRRREKGSPYSALLLISMIATFMFGLVLGPDHADMLAVVNTVIVPVEATLMAVLAVTLLYASIRLLRRRTDRMSVIFLITAVVMLAASATLPFGASAGLNDFVRPWIQQVLALGGARGILIGVALGTLTTGFRVLFGADRPYGRQMMDTIRCAVCGETNPAELEFCRNCSSRLQPLTGPLKGEASPIQPGQIPTKKVTADLEPILPQWLRDARQKSRQSAEEGSAGTALQRPAAPAATEPDLLAGLASQSDDDEGEAPAWLTTITGSAPEKKKKPDDSRIKWVELGGGTGDLQRSAPAIGATEAPAASPHPDTGPSWMAPSEPAPARDELADWFSSADQPPAIGAFDRPATPEPPPASVPEASLASDMDWLKNLESQPFSRPTEAEPTTAPRPSAFKESRPAAPSGGGDLPDWLSNLQAQASAMESQPPAQPVPPAPAAGQLPDWLNTMQAQASAIESRTPAPPEPPPAAPSTPAADVPDWLRAFGQPTAAAAPSAAPSQPESNVPDWLRDAAPQSTEPEAPAAPAAPPKPFTGTLGKAETPVDAPQEPSPASAFADDSIENADVNSIFASMQIPDWLASAAPTNALQTPAETSLPPVLQADQSIAPADLPSWVQAMRPAESTPGSTASGSGAQGDLSVEPAGPFAGLQGILPVGHGVRASSKPKAHANKLNATDEHQAQALLLEQILSAETAPVPMQAVSALAAQRALRWALTVLLVVLVGGTVLAGTQFLPLPVTVPNQTAAAIKAVEAVPADAPVLVVFDYEPSTIGELQAVSAPLIDHMLVLSHPRLALLSTSATGAALAEQFMSSTQAGHHYQAGTQYVNLGYVPGGLTGVYDFAQNPSGTVPLGADGNPAWGSAALKGVTHLSDFATIIVLTDSAETGRVWIEQAGPWRGQAPLVIVSSAQAGPLLLPYYNSGQLSGLVAGLSDGVSVEQSNSGRPGSIRRYWDAYSIGLLLAVMLIVLGGLWNLTLGLRARRLEQEQG